MDRLIESTKVLISSNAAAAAQTDLDGAVIDLGQDQGYDGVLFIAVTGDVTATSALNLKAMISDASDGGSPTEHAATGVFTAGASDADNKVLLLDVYRPGKRYVFSRLLRGAANAVVQNVIAILYRGRAPVTQASGTVIKQALGSPAS